MSHQADISVVAANYNNAPYLREFFEAFISSTVLPRELLFIDDGSTDNSVEIARSYEEVMPFLKVMVLGQNRGFANALNAGVEVSLGKYILRVDPDDVISKHRIERQYEVLESGVCDVIGSNAEMFHAESGDILGKTNFPLVHLDIKRKIISGEHGVLHPTVMARSYLFKKHHYIQKNVPAEDYDIFARFLSDGAVFSNLPETLIRYRVHKNSASNKLPFSTIEKTFSIRDEIFETNTSLLRVCFYYVHIKSYRKFLFSQSAMLRLFYGLLSSVAYPSKFFLRLRRYVMERGRV